MLQMAFELSKIFPFRDNQIYTPFLELLLSKLKICIW